MNIFVLNCGRLALKFQLIKVEQEKVLARGLIEKIGTDNALLSYTPHNQNTFHKVMEIKDYDMAVKLILNALTDPMVGVLQDIGEIAAVGHRVVHGGERFSDSVLLTPIVVDGIKACMEFAPLHNPLNLQGIEACSKWIPDIDQVAVFDTAFHTHLPEYAFIYGLPYDVYEQLKIRRYGFHGISHRYASQQAAAILNRNYADFKAIICHLGSGSSIAAVKDGISVDTTMGFTPLEGLIMGTRCGNIDPAIIPYLMEKEHLACQEIEDLMNTASGLKGISKMTHDMLEIEEEAEAGSELPQLALEMFCYRVKKYIGEYFAVLGDVDAVVFTAGIGENSATVRRKVCEGLACFGITLDEQKNQRSETVISTGPTPVLIIPRHEELAIAKETYRIVYEKRQKRRAEQEGLKIQEALSTLTDADKAKITLLWSHHQDLAYAQLYELVQREMRLTIDLNAFEALLTKMGFTKP